MSYFTIEARRSVFESMEITYESGVLHPTRYQPLFHDFVYMIDGSWDFAVEDSVFRVYPGDVFILPAGSNYRGVSPCDEGTKNVFLHVSFCAGEDQSPEKGGASPSDALPLNTVIHCQNEPIVRALFDEIKSLRISDIPQKEAMISGLFSALLCYLYRCDNRVAASGHDVVDDALAIMRDNPHIIYKESEVAAMLFISVKTLRNGFLRRFNKTFYRYQIDYKLEQAYSLMTNKSDIKVYEISCELGFCDEFHLSKTFKKKYGISPTAFKKLLYKERN